MDRREFTSKCAAATLGAVTQNYTSLVLGKDTMAREAAMEEPPFKLSVMLWTVFKDLPFEQRLEKVAEAGYQYVELVGEHEKWSEDEFSRFNAKRKEIGISFDCTAEVSHGITNPVDRDALLAKIREVLVSMERLDCPSLILLSGNVVPGMTREAQHQSCIDGLRAAARLVEGRKIAGKPVRLLLESIDPEENPRYFLTSAAEGFEIVKAVNHAQVKFLYDFYHEQIAEGNLIAKLEKNIQHLGLVHIADVPGRHEPGTGEINYLNIFRKLTDLKYDGVAAMEFFPTGDPVMTLRVAREMALQSSREQVR